MKIHFKPRFFIIFGIILAFAVGTFFYIRQERGVAFKTFEKGKIIPVTSKDVAIKNLKDQYKNKFVIIFFYDGYTDQNQALTAVQVLKAAVGLVEPFKSLSKDIVFKTFTTDSSKCHVKQENAKGILICDARLIESFRALGIDHFKLVILSPLAFNSTVLPARGSNSWMTLSTAQGNLSIEDHKRFLGLSFMQSLGRSLGLSTEDDGSVSSSSATLLSPRMPNCALDAPQAKEWWGKIASGSAQTGYFKGCLGNPTYIYPQQDTLMSTHPKKESYGSVSEDYLKGILSCFYLSEGSYKDSLGSKSCDQFKNQYSDFWTE